AAPASGATRGHVALGGHGVAAEEAMQSSVERRVRGWTRRQAFGVSGAPVAALATSIAASALVAACARAGGAPPAGQSAPGAGARLQGTKLVASTWLDQGNDTILSDFLAEFNGATGAQAEQVVGQNDDKLQTQLAGGTPPDLFFMSTNAAF